MAQCLACDRTFFPEGTRWGGLACGECIADQIERELMRHLFGDQRKPLRRAGSETAGVEQPTGAAGLDAPADRRSA